MASGSTKAVVTALFANLGIALSKFVAFLFTNSSSMLAESVHSVADSSNQALLLLGGKRARQEATPEHPFGYGRARYVYAFVVSIVLFSLGGLFALYEGYSKIAEPHELVSPFIAVGVLLVAMVLEGYALRTAVRESNHIRGEQSWVEFVRRARAPELPVILLEDVGAMCGLVFALTGVGLSALTGNPVWDGLGTMSIGVLLVVIAVILAIETKSLLIGEGATPAHLSAIERALAEEPLVDRIIHMKTLHLGPEELLVAAKIAVEHDDTAGEVARAINAAERRIRDAVPIARVIYLEPDIDRADRGAGADGAGADGARRSTGPGT
jgi:cation diffusion facilitator family transporter